jgi:hypothetical protein
VLFADCHSPGIVQVRVARFSDYDIDASYVIVSRLIQRVAICGVDGGANRHRAGEDYGRFNISQFIDLGGSGQLAETVAGKDGRGYLALVKVVAVWKNRCRASPNVIPFDNCCVSNQDTAYIGDRVETTRLEKPDGQPEVSCASPLSIHS